MGRFDPVVPNSCPVCGKVPFPLGRNCAGCGFEGLPGYRMPGWLRTVVLVFGMGIGVLLIWGLVWFLSFANAFP